jgi:hypothetical protein
MLKQIKIRTLFGLVAEQRLSGCKAMGREGYGLVAEDTLFCCEYRPSNY